MLPLYQCHNHQNPHQSVPLPNPVIPLDPWDPTLMPHQDMVIHQALHLDITWEVPIVWTGWIKRLCKYIVTGKLTDLGG